MKHTLRYSNVFCTNYQWHWTTIIDPSVINLWTLYPLTPRSEICPCSTFREQIFVITNFVSFANDQKRCNKNHWLTLKTFCRHRSTLMFGLNVRKLIIVLLIMYIFSLCPWKCLPLIFQVTVTSKRQVDWNEVREMNWPTFPLLSFLTIDLNECECSWSRVNDLHKFLKSLHQ